MPERQGGSYVVDSGTGAERRVEGTVQEAEHTLLKDVPGEAQAPAPPEQAAKAPAPEPPARPPEPASGDTAAGAGRRAPAKP